MFLFRCSRVLAVLAVLLAVSWARGTGDKMLGGLTGFSWHPVLMILGFTLCMGEALLAFRHGRGKAQNKLTHVALHCASLVCVVGALRAVFADHNAKNAPNLYTAHGIVGLAVCVLFFAQFAVGALVFLTKYVRDARKAAVLPYHVIVGVVCYLFSTAAITSGVAEKLAWMGCTYQIAHLDAPDVNPAAHYHLLPIGCKLGIGVAVCALLAGLCVAVGVLGLKIASQHPDGYTPVAVV